MKPMLLLAILFCSFIQTLDRTITGTIRDRQNNLLQGVKVYHEDRSKFVTTDTKGRFKIAVPAESKTLSFSFIGYVDLKLPITSSQTMNVTMIEDKAALDEVIVVGNGVSETMKNQRLAFSDAMNSYVSMPVQTNQIHNTENYNPIQENGFQNTKQQAVTTFSIDVDRAAYSNTRRFLNAGQLPPTDAVRIEEMINYFDYQYPQPTGEHPIAVTTELSDSPWNKGLKLLHVGLQAKTVATDNLPVSNLVFLIDVSGSMMTHNKLPLLKQAFKLLTDQLRPVDKVSIVVYAGAAGLVLPATSGNEKLKIREAIESLEAGGSTAGGEGINLAYKIAAQHFIKNGNNRVILATDGDFNVGVSSEGDLQRLVEEKRKSGISLSITGFGMGNYKDSYIETMADKGNGNYAYIDNIQEARKVFVSEFGGTLFTVAKDVKIQIEFNPDHVRAYRLIGYENRSLKNEEFHDDKKDAGEMGSGHTVTALYEIVPVGVESNYLPKTDELKYQKTEKNKNYPQNELLTLKIRYKKPDGEKSSLFEIPVKNTSKSLVSTSDNFRFAAAVAEFGLLLRRSEFVGTSGYGQVIKLAKGASGKDEEGYRSEFVQLVKTAEMLDSGKETAWKDR
ncbi:VWA domain-containing protein [Dyadobacter sp. CY312]|uniref:vWA domain-containing protein n=1 Tax=Dyadobacter sp. CY312 TaxID=2907303 RepID=UPI001F33D026|nr:VWA domain-containing protein [Dyadobacter sp. CY312]MCE7041491.1 von Willebrand factor type A domain-containing protein [Dyadobacter sp. CY312]